MFEEEFGYAVVSIAKEAELIPTVLKLCKMLSDIALLSGNCCHEHAEMHGQHEMGLRFVNGLQVRPHLV